MQDYTDQYRLAVEQAIKMHHAIGHPAYQCKDGYIVAIYPGGKEVRLQKTESFSKID